MNVSARFLARLPRLDDPRGGWRGRQERCRPERVQALEDEIVRLTADLADAKRPVPLPSSQDVRRAYHVPGYRSTSAAVASILARSEQDDYVSVGARRFIAATEYEGGPRRG